ncbi:MAG: four-carbon acid sugar kinase family protein [Ilumatobacteraceae bacterium]
MGPSSSQRGLVVSADDTTGALESAAVAADVGWHATVVPHGRFDGADAAPGHAVVVDLRSRHSPPGVAAARFAEVASSVRVHKIDSTLRGNWPAELSAAIRAGRRVLMVPAFPAAGRVCIDGIVHEHGVPVERTVHGRDPRSSVRTSRPASLLDGAVELSSAHAVRSWLQAGAPAAVVDASTDDDIAAALDAIAGRDDVLPAGPAAVVAAVAGRAVGDGARPTWITRLPVVVVCGSAHPVSRSQVAQLVAAGAVPADVVDEMPVSTPTPAVAVVTSPDHPDGDPAGVVRALADRARQLVRAMGATTVVLVGGDTAEAFIGDGVVRVDCSIGTGVAAGWVTMDGRRLALISKPGAFGGERTLVDLMQPAFDGSAR